MKYPGLGGHHWLENDKLFLKKKRNRLFSQVDQRYHGELFRGLSFNPD